MYLILFNNSVRAHLSDLLVKLEYLRIYMYYEVQSLFEDHGFFLKSGHSKIARKLILINFKPFRITCFFVKLVRGYCFLLLFLSENQYPA